MLEHKLYKEIGFSFQWRVSIFLIDIAYIENLFNKKHTSLTMEIKFQENFIVLVTYLEHEASFA